MRDFGLRMCLFLFLAAMFSGRTNELGVLVGATTGTVLLWPIYLRYVSTSAIAKRRPVVVEEAEAAIPPR
jgi:xanthine/uracil permease